MPGLGITQPGIFSSIVRVGIAAGVGQAMPTRPNMRPVAGRSPYGPYPGINPMPIAAWRASHAVALLYRLMRRPKPICNG